MSQIRIIAGQKSSHAGGLMCSKGNRYSPARQLSTNFTCYPNRKTLVGLATWHAFGTLYIVFNENKSLN
jgi:hypothetical protein